MNKKTKKYRTMRRNNKSHKKYRHTKQKRQKRHRHTRRHHGKGSEEKCKNIIESYIKCKNNKGVSNQECLKIFQNLKYCINK